MDTGPVLAIYGMVVSNFTKIELWPTPCKSVEQVISMLTCEVLHPLDSVLVNYGLISVFSMLISHPQLKMLILSATANLLLEFTSVNSGPLVSDKV